MDAHIILMNLRMMGIREDWIKHLEAIVTSQEKLSAAVSWVVQDASYKAPEEVSLELVGLYISKLSEANRP